MNYMVLGTMPLHAVMLDAEWLPLPPSPLDIHANLLILLLTNIHKIDVSSPHVLYGLTIWCKLKFC